MVVISVLYPKNDQSHFDHDYYMQKHMPMVQSRWQSMGLINGTLLRGTATLEGAPPAFELIGTLTFSTMEEVNNALTAHGAEIINDIPNFTDVSPLIQINQPLS